MRRTNDACRNLSISFVAFIIRNNVPVPNMPSNPPPPFPWLPPRRGHGHRRRENVVRGLRHVDVVVGVHGFFGAHHAAKHLYRAVRYHLVVQVEITDVCTFDVGLL